MHVSTKTRLHLAFYELLQILPAHVLPHCPLSLTPAPPARPDGLVPLEMDSTKRNTAAARRSAQVLP